MFKRILVPTDGSKYAKKAENIAIDIAKQMNSTIVGLHIIDENLGLSFDTSESEANKILNLFRKQVEDESLTYESVIIFADPAHDMKTISEKSKVDLIVIAAHGNSESANHLLGTVADNTLKSVKVPVLLIK